jgi:hypothetical protein
MTEQTEEDRKAMELFPDIPKRVSKNTPFPWSLDCDGDLLAADRRLVAIILSAEDRPLLAAAPEMRAIIMDLLAEKSGSEKSCGHQFDCVCAAKTARAILDRVG